jgi:hypothetical protein
MLYRGMRSRKQPKLTSVIFILSSSNWPTKLRADYLFYALNSKI